MVDGIKGNSPISAINFSNISAKNNTPKKLGVFGFGASRSSSGNPISALIEKFNFEPVVYKKGVSQLQISDTDYMQDVSLEDSQFCEV